MAVCGYEDFVTVLGCCEDCDCGATAGICSCLGCYGSVAV